MHTYAVAMLHYMKTKYHFKHYESFLKFRNSLTEKEDVFKYPFNVSLNCSFYS
jgi:hypothetical protein